VFQSAPGRVVVETGAVDRPAPGPLYFIGYDFDKVLRGKQLLWEEYLRFLIADDQAGHAFNPFYPIQGVWNQNPTYVRDALCGYMDVTICR